MAGPEGGRVGDRTNRSFCPELAYASGGMRRDWLKGGGDIAKGVLIHSAAFNFGLRVRKVAGFGRPRGCGDAGQRVAAACAPPALRTERSTTMDSKSPSISSTLRTRAREGLPPCRAGTRLETLGTEQAHAPILYRRNPRPARAQNWTKNQVHDKQFQPSDPRHRAVSESPKVLRYVS